MTACNRCGNRVAIRVESPLGLYSEDLCTKCIALPLGSTNVDSAGRGVCLGCGGYLKPRFVDGYCGNGCDIAFEAGKAAGRREAMLEVAAEARQRAEACATIYGDNDMGVSRYEDMAAWADGRARKAGAG